MFLHSLLVYIFYAEMPKIILIIVNVYLKVKVTHSCPTLSDPMDYIYSPWNFQARILKWVAFPFSRGLSWPKNQTRVSWIAGGFFINWAIREAPSIFNVFFFSMWFLAFLLMLAFSSLTLRCLGCVCVCVCVSIYPVWILMNLIESINLCFFSNFGDILQLFV